MTRITFKSEGLNLVGHLYVPPNFKSGQAYPTLICVGCWITVKEQMAGLYAKRLADLGFICFTFDFRNYGESEGLPRAWESPLLKIQDLKNAAAYLQSLDEVDSDRIGALGIGAGAMYVLMAAAETSQIKAVATAASWLQNASTVQQLYGGEVGVQERIAAAQAAKCKYANTGTFSYIKAVSTEDPTAAMYGDYDYYLNPKRGGIAAWNPDQFAVASWEDWLQVDPFPSASQISVPLLMIHSDACILPHSTKAYFEAVCTPYKTLVWVPTRKASPEQQYDFYDQASEVNLVVKHTSVFFKNYLKYQ
jgi:fermentation-respiration switch protein FrsA (DUF1100 family)